MVFRTVLIIISFLGICLTYRHYRKTRFIYTPAIVTSIIMYTVFMGGVFQIMKYVAIGMYWFGLLCFLFEVFRILTGKADSFSKEECIHFVIWAAGIALLSLYLVYLEPFPVHYDDFSFWGIAARLALLNDRFPNAQDASFILHRAYPPGAASFIYFFCKNLSSTRSLHLLFAQLFALYNCYFVIFGAPSGAKHFRKAGYLLTALVLILLLHFNISVSMLLVDNLLSASIFACVMIGLLEKDALRERAVEIGILSAATAVIKNAGFLFIYAYIFTVMYWLCRDDLQGHTRKEKTAAYLKSIISSKNRSALFSMIALPLMTMLIWKARTLLVFKLHGVNSGAHSMSFNYYIRSLISGEYRTWFTKLSILLPYFLIPLLNLASIPVFLSCFLPRKLLGENANVQKWKDISKLSIILFTVYEIGLLGMYLFSMSVDDIIGSHGSDYMRYNGIITAVLHSLLFFMVMQISIEYDCMKNKRQKRSIICTILCIVIMLFFGDWFESRNSLEAKFSNLKYLEQVMNENIISESDHIIVYFDTDYGIPDNGMIYYLYPCRNYHGVYSEDAFNAEKSSGKYSIIIDTVNSNFWKEEIIQKQ